MLWETPLFLKLLKQEEVVTPEVVDNGRSRVSKREMYNRENIMEVILF
jgi:hypothetical protein